MGGRKAEWERRKGEGEEGEEGEGEEGRKGRGRKGEMGRGRKGRGREKAAVTKYGDGTQQGDGEV